MKTPTEIPLSTDSNEVAKWIWRTLIPKSGQCDTVQGELLRAVERLSWEAQNNGNINWDAGFQILIDYLERTLCDESEIPVEAKTFIRKDLIVLRDFESPYTGDDLYARLTEAVVLYCRLHPRLLPRPQNPLLLR